MSSATTSALSQLGWTMRRNLSCLRAQTWPFVDLESIYPGVVTLSPDNSTFPDVAALYTDGSIQAARGGAAVISLETTTPLVTSLPIQPVRSSTHCELVALILALHHHPPQVLSDSLAALTMVHN